MNNLGNKKVCHFDIYYLEKSAGTSYKYQFFNQYHIILISPIFLSRCLKENLSDEDLKSATKNAFQELVNRLENEDSDISDMFCSPIPELEVFLTYFYIIINLPYKTNILGKIRGIF